MRDNPGTGKGGHGAHSLPRASQRGIKGEAVNGAARHVAPCKNVIARYRTVGGFSDALQRGALPTSDNVVLRLQPVESSARCFHAAAGALRIAPNDN